ncbi:MAG TPA: hypothetical protein VHV55_03135 [Pirellulales bacterium]|jgi:hypothetical protein|nr:hypothetical protein [Pirellulales bacterium]
MHDTLAVSELQASGSLQDVIDSCGHRERAVLLDQRGKVFPVDVFHDEEVGAMGLVGVVGRHNMGVAQFGGGFHFALEAGHRGRILGDRGRQHLERHHALHAAMLGLEHLLHATRTDLVEDRVVAEDQRLDFARQDVLRLKRRQLAGLDEFLGKRLRIFRRRSGRNEVLELAGGNDATVFNLLNELFERNDHGRGSDLVALRRRRL